MMVPRAYVGTPVSPVDSDNPGISIRWQNQQ